MKIEKAEGYRIIAEWMERQGRKPFAFQKETWQHFSDKKDGIVMKCWKSELRKCKDFPQKEGGRNEFDRNENFLGRTIF